MPLICFLLHARDAQRHNLDRGPVATGPHSPAAGYVLGAGDYQALSVTFTPDDTADDTTASRSVYINVTGTGPAITWNPPAPIVYGTALSDAHLNATASISGTFAYSPTAGTVLNAGSDQILTSAPAGASRHLTGKHSFTEKIRLAPQYTEVELGLDASPKIMQQV